MLRFGRTRAKPSVVTLADQARDQGEWERAAEHYQEALRRNPQNAAVWVQYGHVLKEAGRPAEAERMYQKALSYDPRCPDSYLQLGHVLKIQGKLEEARAAYLRAFALDPLLADASSELQQLGWSEAHCSELRGMLVSSTNPPMGSEDINGKSYEPLCFDRKSSREFRAQQGLSRAGFSFKRLKYSPITLADRARDAGQWDLAAGHYRQALSRNPQNAPILVQYGHVLKESGHLFEAEKAYGAATIYQPADADAHLHLGHVLKLQGKEREAEAFFLRAYAIEPSLPYALPELEALGWSKAKLAQLERLLSPAGCGGVSHDPQQQPTPFSPQSDSPPREGKRRSARPIQSPAKTLFPGSTFAELTVTSDAEVPKIIRKSATPADQLARVDAEQYSPVISIILPVYNTPAVYFREVTQCVFSQTYTNWEMCIADDGSTRSETIAIRQELAQSKDPRIKVMALPENQGIAEASQAALQMATGDYVAFVDHDDLITLNALSEVVALLRDDPIIDYVYTDHVQADRDGFPKSVASKPEWSPEFLLSTNYIVHFKIVRRSLLLSVGGLTGEMSHVQDLGMTWRLVEAKARIVHLPKPVYLWREHQNSVASTTEAKPGIENLLVDVYDRHLSHISASASQTWPQPFKGNRTGVFRVDFKNKAVRTSLVVFMKSGFERPAEIKERIGSEITNRVDLHFVSLGNHSAKAEGVKFFAEDQEFNEFLSSLQSEFVVFINSTARFITPKWLDDIVGYLTLDERIGAVGGKVLDEFLRVRAGGLLVDRQGRYQIICGGEFDNNPGHWFIGQVASNVDAVSSQLLAARVKLLSSSGGLRVRDYEDAWGLPFCQYLRENDFRVVYNPFSKIFDPGRVFISTEARARIAKVGRAASTKRYYAAL